MKLIERYRRLTLWNKLAAWGAVSSLVAIPLAILLFVLGRSNVPSIDPPLVAPVTAGDHVILPVRNSVRIYITQTPREMMEGVRGLTSQQAAVLLNETLADKWVRIRGPVADIVGDLDYAMLVFRIEGVTTRVKLAPDHVERASHLQVGDVVTVDALFGSLDRVGPDFTSGEFPADSISGLE